MQKPSGATIKLFLVDGTSEGLKIIEKDNWTGQALSCSRAQFPTVKARAEFHRPGVYLLLGVNEGQSAPMIYIGEGDPTLPRIEAHARAKDFWTKLVLLTSKDHNMNKAHIQYLESRLVELARVSNRYERDNGNSPTLPALSEAEIAQMEHFLHETLLMYSVLGITAFEIPSAPVTQLEPEFFLKIGSEVVAKGFDKPEGFLVLKDSKATGTEAPSLQKPFREMREDLTNRGVFRKEGSFLILTQDYVFNTPSRASCVFLGRSSNGRTDWRTSDGRPLRDLRD